MARRACMHGLQGSNWVDEWRKLSTGASDVADRLSKGHTPSAEMQAVRMSFALLLYG